MKYPSIRIEGAILSADILDKIEQGDLLGQKQKDFRFEGSRVQVKEEIVKAWADAQDMWRIFTRRMEAVPTSKAGTTETRTLWTIPLLSLLGYEVELKRQAEIINEKTYAISHQAINLDGFPIHVMGFRDSLDKRRLQSGPRMSPHALLQEFLNLHEHLYAIVSNGVTLRLLRDSSRLIKLSYIEFDLERMFEEEHFADFALMFRLLHSSRMPTNQEAGAESLIEGYHQDSLDSGSRIREGLSAAVEDSIKAIANGFLSHPDNQALNAEIEAGSLDAGQYYQYQLRFIYRLLFLMVIEERDLIFTPETAKQKRDLYYNYYSVNRIRRLSEKRYLYDKKNHDVWIGLRNTFKLFESGAHGTKLDIHPLAGDLFGREAIGVLNQCNLDNKVLLECLRNLSLFTNPHTGQKMRVNYASLNVEEFGSVYEGLLEYDPALTLVNGRYEFSFVKGDARASSGSHYTPDELVQPLIKHSLDYVIADKLKATDSEQALLSITVCDVACGSGHILLSAARRIATELAKVRTGEDQPSPTAFRQAIRDVIRNCIHGVDLNPLAVELAKVALWLEAHNPGEPLNFLDHRIKCGDAIVGLAHKEELENGIATEAFKRLPGDDKDIARLLGQKNRQERKLKGADTADAFHQVEEGVISASQLFQQFNLMPENTPKDIKVKQTKYQELIRSEFWQRLRTLADIQVAQFFIPKTEENRGCLVTESTYQAMWTGAKNLSNCSETSAVEKEAAKRRFFHWFVEFPEVMAQGGFDCILGNPPFLGGKKISSKYGLDYVKWLKYNYPTTGSSDLVGYFFRRVFTIVRQNGFQSLIATNTIGQGDTRRVGLEQILNHGGSINYAVRSMRWPGLAAVEISQVAIHKGLWKNEVLLDNSEVDHITSYLDDYEQLGNPYQLEQNHDKSFIGSFLYGKGFVLNPKEAKRIIENNPKNRDVLFPYLSGHDLNTRINQTPSRWVINFFDWDEEKCRREYPDCFNIIESLVKPERMKLRDKGYRENWWQFGRRGIKLYHTITSHKRVIVNSLVSKYCLFTYEPTNIVFSHRTSVFPIVEKSAFCILQTTFHDVWTWKYTSTLGSSTINYSPSDCFETFPFPQNLSNITETEFEQIGDTYYEFRQQLMNGLQLGLTKTYNQFHNCQLAVFNEQLNAKEIEKRYSKETLYLWKHLKKTENACSLEKAVDGIIHLRQLHKKMDEAVLSAYGWNDINLSHDFYEVDYLPENDRVRYTVSLAARKEVLKRLLLLNHEIYEEEVKQGLHDKEGKKRMQRKASDEGQGKLF